MNLLFITALIWFMCLDASWKPIWLILPSLYGVAVMVDRIIN